MKTRGTIFLAPLIFGMGLAAAGLSNLGSEGFGILQWCLAILAVLLIGVIIGCLLNFTVFAPVYWLLGRRQPKKIETQAKHDPEA